MTDTERLAQRLIRLFRIERNGGFEARPPGVARQLRARRAALIERLIAQCEASGAPRLDRALAQLAGEVRRSRHQALARLERLEIELRLRRGGSATGMRGGGGQLLGRG